RPRRARVEMPDVHYFTLEAVPCILSLCGVLFGSFRGMASRWIEIGAGKAKARAYVAVPTGGSRPGLALFHENKGPREHATRLADLLAEEGYVVLAPDDPSEGTPDATIGALRQLAEVKGDIGAFGFGGGGTRALEAAAAGSVVCAVVYYGEG